MARRGRTKDRDAAALVLALVLHGIAWLGVRAWAEAHRVPAQAANGGQPERATPAPDEIAIELAESSPTAATARAAGRGPSVAVTPPRAPSVAVTPPRAPSVAVTPPHAPSVAVTPPRAPSVAVTPPRAPSIAVTPPAAGAAAAGDHPIDLGIGPDAWQRWALSEPIPPRAPSRRPRGRPLVRAPPASTTGGLQEGLDAHDRELGLGPAGRVARALFEASHSPEAPEVGMAWFNVTVWSTGAVEVSLGPSTDAKWQVVATRAAADLRRTPPRVPAPHRGYRLTVRILAEETLPSGRRRSDLRGPHLEATPPELHDLKAAQREIQLKNPALALEPAPEIHGSPLVFEPPGVYVAGTTRACNYRIGLSLTGLILQGGCAPEDVGAHFQRIVRTEVSEQSAF